MQDNYEERIAELEREIEKLKRELNKLKTGQEWYENELEDQNKRITIIERILDVYYDSEASKWQSRYLKRIYATLKKLERKLEQKKNTTTQKQLPT
ncbi:hypothetical protein [Thermococcus gammatolerans]|uniref:Uncharacterized protein n=1 Tax=Thermococcus gammatolerans (strain DSM 15229 / JCM 11827 / EJ3) TaxID=593117 RepID=C5A7B2_THEGJ|nr:hypothetical protein [Thermococcus gammatolerans]ACS34124.1 Hypothetical protein TGAM_1622 [Thermococcus gammatolerans EJ3]